jgi:sugar O-acyltransferase (sialic acid O-acetyltransferase NeuD family)
VIIGAGGHGREVAEILRHQESQGGQLQAIGYIDERQETRGLQIDGLPVLGDWRWFQSEPEEDIAVICAVGSPCVARRLVQRALDLNLPFVNAISPLARISPLASIGRGVAVFPNVVVNTGARLGDYSILNVGASVSHDTQVGAYSNINPGVRLAGNVVIGEGCYLGMGSNIIQGISVGEWTTVGAGAAVIRDLPSHVTAVGVPAKVIKQEEGQRNAR